MVFGCDREVVLGCGVHLRRDWSGRVWLNPPYGRRRSKGNKGLWSYPICTVGPASTVPGASGTTTPSRAE